MVASLHLKEYTLGELNEQVLEELAATSNYIPFSTIRLKSYKANPRAKANDKVLFALFDKNLMVAFRAVLPDIIYIEGKEQRMAWGGGAWTHPDYRRQGLNRYLDNYVYPAWDNCIMYSNYWNVGHNLHKTAGRYTSLTNYSGKRFFLRSALEQLLTNKYPKKRWIAKVGMAIDKFKEKRKESNPLPINLEFESVLPDNNDLADFLKKHEVDIGLRRSKNEFYWICNYPWLSEKPIAEKGTYPFSRLTKRQKNLLYVIKQNNKIAAFVFFHIKGDQITIPYFITSTEKENNLAQEVCKLAINLALKFDLQVIKTMEVQLCEFFQDHSNYFTLTRPYNQQFWALTEMTKIHPKLSKAHFFDGDGDHVFSN